MCAQHAEVVGVVRVLPDVLAGKDKILPERLLKSRVELIAPAWTERRYAGGGREKRIQNRIGTSYAGKHQVLIEGRFQRARIRNTQYGIGTLDVISDTKSRFGFPMCRKSVVEITAQSQVEGPVSFGDRVLNVESQFFDVGVSVETVKGRSRCVSVVGSARSCKEKSGGCCLRPIAGQSVAVGERPRKRGIDNAQS